MMKIDAFIRMYLVRNDQMVDSSKVFENKKIFMPFGNIIHYMDFDNTETGMSGGHSLLLNTSDIRVHHIVDLSVKHGHPTIKNFSFNSMEALHFRKNPKLRKASDVEKHMGIERQLLIFDYTLLNHRASYTGINSLFQEWANVRETVISNINTYATRRNNMLYVQLPEIIPELHDFVSSKSELTSETQREIWKSPELLDLLALWHFVKGEGILAGLTEQAINTTQVVFADAGNYIFVPLKRLRVDDKHNSTHDLQNKFYKLITKLRDSRIDVVKDGDVDEESPKTETTKEEQFNPVVESEIRENVSSGMLTPAEEKRFRALHEKVRTLKSPFSDLPIGEYIKEVEGESAIETIKKHPIKKAADPTALKFTVNSLYGDKAIALMQKNIIRTVLDAENFGLIIDNIESENIRDNQNNYAEIKCAVKPLLGAASTLTFQIPNFKSDGSFEVGGVNYRMDTQVVDAPIRKAGPSKTSLTSYTGKLFVRRSVKASESYSRWVSSRIVKASYDKDSIISSVAFNSVHDRTVKVPILYSGLSQLFSGFKYGKDKINFDYSERENLYGKEAIAKYEKDGKVIIGKWKDGFILLDEDSYVHYASGIKVENLGKFERFFGLGDNPPTDFATVDIFGKSIPLLFVLGYTLGFDKLVKQLGVKYRIVNTTRGMQLEDYERVIKFKDEIFIYDSRNRLGSMILSGFYPARKLLTDFRRDQLNRKGAYNTLLTLFRASSYHLREIVLLNKCFVDHITKRLLVRMKEPTEFNALLIRAAELILTDDYPEEKDTRHMRFRTHDRIAGFVHLSMIEAMREFNNKPISKRSKIEMNPRSVLMRIISDPTTMLVKDINPLHFLKEMEAVSLSGEGGRSAETLMLKSRAYNEHDMGVISEAGPDSGKVGIRSYFTPNASVEDMYGMIKPTEGETGQANYISSVACTLPQVTHDDGKRVNLGGIQMSSVVGSKGYRVYPIGTGYEEVVGIRTADGFATKAGFDGKVIKLTDKEMIISDGKKTQGIQLGVRHGISGGDTLPHNMVSDLKVGDKVSQNDIVCWADDFFERDFRNKENVILKIGAIANIAFKENLNDLEDSSIIMSGFSKVLSSGVSGRRVIVVDFDADVQEMVKIGDHLLKESVLMTIGESTVSQLEDKDAVAAALNKMARGSPRAKNNGVVSNIEITYVGNITDMSPSVQKLANSANKERKRLITELGLDLAKDCSVKDPCFVFGERVERNQMAITIYIDEDIDCLVGDKISIANQLKSIVGLVLDGVAETESGRKVDIIFGGSSASNRIVLSMERMGVAALIIMAITQLSVKHYLEDRNK